MAEDRAHNFTENAHGLLPNGLEDDGAASTALVLSGGAGLDRAAGAYLVSASLANAIPGAGVKLTRGQMTAE
jgi:hypothetical protein